MIVAVACPRFRVVVAVLVQPATPVTVTVYVPALCGVMVDMDKVA